MTRNFNSVEQITYNEFRFPETTLYKLEGTPVYNKADNAVKYTNYTLVVDSVMDKDDVASQAGGTTADNLATYIRNRLNSPGKLLVIKDSGFGDFYIDASVDQAQGPKPRLIQFENLGAGNCIRVSWTVEFTVSECSISKAFAAIASSVSPSWNDGTILEFTVAMSSDYNVRRRETIRYDIYVETKTEIDNARKTSMETAIKRFLDIVGVTKGIALVKPNMKFDWSFSLSENKRAMNATYRGEEIDSESVYPWGVEEIKLEHTVESDLQKGFRLWDNEFNGFIRLYPGTPRELAYFHFLNIFRERYMKGIQGVSERRGYRNAKQKILFPRILKIKIVDHLYDQDKVSFMVRYSLALKDLNDIVKRTGLFKPVAYGGTNWVAYDIQRRGTDPLNDTLAKHYGDLREKVIDPCNQPSTYYNYKYKDGITLFADQSITQAQCPPPEDSWLKYDIQVVMKGGRQVKEHKRYATVTPKKGTSLTESAFGVFPDRQMEDKSSDQSYDDTYQVLGLPNREFVMRGVAVRWGGPTPAPNIKKFAGLDVELVDEVIDDRIVDSSDCPLHVTKWVKSYYVKGTIKPGTNLTYELDPAISPEDYKHG